MLHQLAKTVNVLYKSGHLIYSSNDMRTAVSIRLFREYDTKGDMHDNRKTGGDFRFRGRGH